MKGGCRHHDRLKHSTLPSSWELRQSRISNTTTLVLKRPRLPVDVRQPKRPRLHVEFKVKKKISRKNSRFSYSSHIWQQ
ncbi:uncharacterized protein LOC142567368 isoform X2 [Dermacentor variabilis]|uniref:uncharacterized protein LOC142567368 isoform X2 n=1 Tax=Dermacentor variabilis TaxID=34621 RepID=UPI003F5B872A